MDCFISYILQYIFRGRRSDLAKTIAVDESTWQKLKGLMKEEGAEDFDHLITMLIERSKKIPKSMFGVDTKLKIKFTQKEHEKIVKDLHS